MLIWEKRTAEKYYQLRSAGQSRRLYTNGIFHSQYKPQSILNGGVWDLLWLPLFLSPPERIRSVLLLGLGSGAAAAKIQRFFPGAQLTAVEIDRWHIYLARRFTRLDRRRVSFVRTDARDWLLHAPAQRFDVVIDDLYFEDNGEPRRVLEYREQKPRWINAIAKRLSKNGLFVVNGLKSTLGRELLEHAHYRGKSVFFGGYHFRQQGFENHVFALSRAPCSLADYQQRLANTLGQQPGRGELSPLVDMRVKPVRRMRR